MAVQYGIGIDLGTSNSVIAVAPIEEGSKGEIPAIHDVTQIISPRTVAKRDILPSALYLGAAQEFEDGALDLPWSAGANSEYCVGEFAREHGALIPDRLVTSAKSWLCNAQVDRKGAILPWRSETVSNKVSPFQASKLYLEHLRRSFESAADQGVSVAGSTVVLTVPASFDEVARALTHEAAEEAGWGKTVLLEEPQAAFYSWISTFGKDWRDTIHPGDLVLVCDIGGGTADFSLIAVSEENGNLALERVSVGEHILLGGDNMDLALAYYLKASIEAQGSKIDSWQFLTLIHSARRAKERLLCNDAPQEVGISVPGRGSNLFAGTVSTRLMREDVQRIVRDGFFPLSGISEQPSARRGLGLQEHGLDFASDPVVTKHLARFLSRSAANVRSDERLLELAGARLAREGSHIMPTAVLFNGGVLKADAIRSRIMQILNSWGEGAEIKELSGADHDLAVARGAAYFAATHSSGRGVRIRSGTARSYYLAVESSAPSVPGMPTPVKGICVVPQGMEEGTERELGGREFTLIAGEKVQFPLLSSQVRAGDEVGVVVEEASEELETAATLEAELTASESGRSELVPVRLHSRVTEVGALELWLSDIHSDRKWKLEFNVRAL